jgi:hypothetical protein
VVVLDELDVDAELGVDIAAVGLLEEAAAVGKGGRLDQDWPVETGRQSLHGEARYPKG